MRAPEELISSIDALPTLPTVVARINELVEDPHSSAADINDVIAKDVALSTRILKLVNSSFYGFPRKIASVTHAVVILGFNTVRTLTLSAFVFDAFEARDLGFGYREFWIHSVATAVASGQLARRVGATDSEQAFLCGLLHDVGKIVLQQYAQEEFARTLDYVQEHDCLLYDAEMAVLDSNHAEMGALLLDRWRLPVTMVEVIRHHHRPEQDSTQNLVTSIVHLADVLCRAMMLGHAGDRCIPTIDPYAWKRLGFSEDDFPDFLEEIDRDMHKVEAFIEMI